MARIAPSAHLVPLDGTSTTEISVLAAQRRLCGWAEAAIPFWQECMAAGERQLFWICVPPTHLSTLDIPVLPQPDGTVAIGHIALDTIDVPSPAFDPDPSLASEDGKVMTIASLYVLPAYARAGIGGWAIRECERVAKARGAEATTLNTLAARHTGEGGVEGPDGTGIWERLVGHPVMPARSNVGWYEKMGYVAYKTIPRYKEKTLDGGVAQLHSTFMKKML